ncbi:MAG: hypothetical protein ACRCUJ_10690 [Phocaeicola sp.]
MKKMLLMIFCLVAVFATVDAKKNAIEIFPRSFGYYTSGNKDSKEITWDQGYGRYGWRNKKKVDLSEYTHIILEIEPTDSRVEIHVIYDNDEDVKVGQIDMGKDLAEVSFDSSRAVKAIYLAKSKAGKAKIIEFSLSDLSEE